MSDAQATPKCDLCGDIAHPLTLRARCHPSAPLRMELSHGILSIFCYVPTCNRFVARFLIAGTVP